MNTNTPKFKLRIGLFIAGGLALFILAIFVIGKQKNLFRPIFKLTSTFYNVSGLQIGCNVRFSGITVGTVDNITIINDSTVQVDMLLRKNVQPFIKEDAQAGIGSSGLIGDRIITITRGSNDASIAKDGQSIESIEPVEMDAIITSVQVTADNAAIISDQLADMLGKVSGGEGALGKLMGDTTIAENISQTMVNLRQSSQGLNENMKAAKSSIFLRGYFEKKEKAAKAKVEDATKAQKSKEKR